MKKRILIAAMLFAALTLGGCGLIGSAENTAQVSKRDSIPFGEGQMYAVAYLGYQTTGDLNYYVDRYLDSDQMPTYRVSDGDCYLVIPRYDGMNVSLYVNDMETLGRTPQFENQNSGPFIVQCNVSDIFPDITVRMEYGGEAVEFSPFISLRDGSLMIGERGLDLTYAAAGDADPYIGEYWDGDMDEPSLVISAGGDGKYAVRISIFRLTSIDDGVGESTGDGLSFTATDAAGNPIGGTITLEGPTATVTFTDSTWEYLPDGTSFQYIKSSGAAGTGNGE